MMDSCRLLNKYGLADNHTLYRTVLVSDHAAAVVTRLAFVHTTLDMHHCGE